MRAPERKERPRPLVGGRPVIDVVGGDIGGPVRALWESLRARRPRGHWQTSPTTVLSCDVGRTGLYGTYDNLPGLKSSRHQARSALPHPVFLLRSVRHGNAQRICIENPASAALEYLPELNASRPGGVAPGPFDARPAIPEIRLRRLGLPRPTSTRGARAASEQRHAAPNSKRAPEMPLRNGASSVFRHSCSSQRPPLRHAQVRAKAQG